jgi:hypothetical protein
MQKLNLLFRALGFQKISKMLSIPENEVGQWVQNSVKHNKDFVIEGNQVSLVQRDQQYFLDIMERTKELLTRSRSLESSIEKKQSVA